VGIPYWYYCKCLPKCHWCLGAQTGAQGRLPPTKVAENRQKKILLWRPTNQGPCGESPGAEGRLQSRKNRRGDCNDIFFVFQSCMARFFKGIPSPLNFHPPPGQDCAGDPPPSQSPSKNSNTCVERFFLPTTTSNKQPLCESNQHGVVVLALSCYQYSLQ
jgi:hypothetical protein